MWCFRWVGGEGACDVWGVQLGLATLPSGGMTELHDECGRALFDLAKEARLHFDLELRSIFTQETAVQVARNAAVAPRRFLPQPPAM